MNKLKMLGVTSALLASSSVFANEGINTAVTQFQTDATASITTIGVAMITVGAVAVGFKWAKAALFS